jgi:isoleucyl-tRNA synthetase
VHKPVVLSLPANGLRLRFDGPDQRLRLIEVLDFTKIQLTYKNKEILKSAQPSAQEVVPSSIPSGPNFRNVYNRLFGPTYPGEYNPPAQDSPSSKGIYVLSYPGIAFSFPLQASAWSPGIDFVSLLSSSAASPATSMAIFQGPSWPETRSTLFTRPPANPRSIALTSKGRDSSPDEIEEAIFHGAGRIELTRRSSPPFWVTLSETTPQDLVAELGPPDAIYRKSDRRISIHGTQPAGTGTSRTARSCSRPHSSSPGRFGDLGDVDHSSNQSYTDESDTEDPSSTANDSSTLNNECFYNYFHHGFDALISFPTAPSLPFPVSDLDEPTPAITSSNLTVTKLLFHANVPGSYPFNRHRRSRWRLQFHLTESDADQSLTSETPFSQISPRLKDLWKDSYASPEEEKSSQRGMVLNRGWGDSPESSVELLGGWEEGVGEKGGVHGDGVQGLGNTELFGFPGMLFEVLKNDTVSCLTIY